VAASHRRPAGQHTLALQRRWARVATAPGTAALSNFGGDAALIRRSCAQGSDETGAHALAEASAHRFLVADIMADVISPEISISSDKVCYIIAKAREFDAKDSPTVPDEASNPSDDRMVEVLEDRPGEDAVLQELRSLIADMSEDEQIDLVALAWLGRGDAGVEGWQELRNEAARAHNRRTAAYLLGMPLLPTYLEDALAQLGLSCEDFDRENL
jgi:hypothetical protein